jgi:uncharacterized zinc-type alcohol dehydrogenase-like protein
MTLAARVFENSETAPFFGRVAQVCAYADRPPRNSARPWDCEPRPLGPGDIELAVTHCGVCHTDAHLVDGDFWLATLVGIVTAVGYEVKALAIGQRVGVGAGSGPARLANNESLAEMRTDHRFAAPIPDALPSAMAATLLCGGLAVYAPLSRLVRPASRVGVIGSGGLGHIALQFARAMDAEVFAFSSSPENGQEAGRVGGGHLLVVCVLKK